MRSIHPVLILGLTLWLSGCSGQHTEQQARHVEQEIKSESQQAEKGFDSGTVTLRVKTALATSDKLSGSHISVSTDGKVVKLTGTVVTEEQKSVADRIVHDTVAKDVQVTDGITVEQRSAQKK